MTEAGKRLIESAQQVLDFAEGTADSTEYRIHIPEEIDVKHIRENLQMSQSEFAEHFGFSVRTLQEWEQGRSVPRGVAKNFLILLQRDPNMVRTTLATPPKHIVRLSERLIIVSKGNDRMVFKRDDGKWANKRNDSDRATSVHDTQKEAVDAAKRNLQNQGGGDLTTKGLDGKIRSKDTIAPGNDPNPPKDKEH